MMLRRHRKAGNLKPAARDPSKMPTQSDAYVPFHGSILLLLQTIVRPDATSHRSVDLTTNRGKPRGHRSPSSESGPERGTSYLSSPCIYAWRLSIDAVPVVCR